MKAYFLFVLYIVYPPTKALFYCVFNIWKHHSLIVCTMCLQRGYQSEILYSATKAQYIILLCFKNWKHNSLIVCIPCVYRGGTKAK